MNYLFESERLLFREFVLQDAEFLYHLNNDPEVIKYTGNPPFASISEAQNFIKEYDHYRRYGFGRWTAVDKLTKKAIGWCGLKYTEELDEIDLGYRFFKSEWNKGYATESGIATLKYAQEHLKLGRIVGRAVKENTASVKVLERVGMKYVSNFDFDGAVGVIYDISL